ncbi:MAG: hypothetical protein COW30_12780 [Rhodospirillales bacterium CG15_BIG_FIL_POST_REV_8_21_14_020_66_15]|nr:MAG: hypothetical protein COW30_12780 [Rhodospirillales bacterium CG15_BIG_FIL_POST_REV_8_21_14_020_66_15]
MNGPAWRVSDGSDRLLAALYLAGIYLGIAAHLPGGTPIPAVVAGAAGMAMLVKHSPAIRPNEISALLTVAVLALISILLAPETGLLRERFKGLVQFGYSLAIGYGFFLAAHRLTGRWLRRYALAFAMLILFVAVLESAVPAVRAASDAFRAWAFDFGVYSSDIRDQALYGRIRPNAFTSEPSFASFGFTMFSFVWYVLSPAGYRTPAYLCLLGLGYFVLSGPTVLLGAPLIAAYQIFLAARTGAPGQRRLDLRRSALGVGLTALLLALAVAAGSIGFSERVEEIFSGRDPSFFSRIVAPPLVAADIVARHPVTGAGLAGWEFIDGAVRQLYATTPLLNQGYVFDSAAHAITNFFWLHWIFLGLLFGALVIVAMTVFLRSLGAPSPMFCWSVWAIFGQAAGGYVDPRTWTVLVLAAVVAVIHEREAAGSIGIQPTGPARSFTPVATVRFHPR